MHKTSLLNNSFLYDEAVGVWDQNVFMSHVLSINTGG